MTRTEKALMANLPPTAAWFTHSVTPGRPTPPSISSLSQPDQDRFTLWQAGRENGTQSGELQQNMTPALTAMMASYEAYYATPAFVAWAAADNMSRIMQWRLSLVDIAEAVSAKGTLPPSFDSAGVGTPAPPLSGIAFPSPSMTESSGDVVSTGGKSPQVVFGDDGDTVSTGDA